MSTSSLRTYAIGDIHGQIDLLRAAHDRITADRARVGDAESPLVHVGDLVDRGPDSRGVVEYLLRGQLAGQPWIVLKGNHDHMFSLHLEGRHDPRLLPGLNYVNPRIGGAATLESYGLPPDATPRQLAAAVPAGHWAFLNGLPRHHLRGDVLFVHAGIRPGVALEAQTDEDLIWIRSPFLEYAAAHPWLVVHGHTHRETPEHRGNRVNIDSGAAYGGPLTAIVIEGRSVFELTPDGRMPLLPGAF